MLNKKIHYGTIVYEGKEYELQGQAEPTSRLLPDHLAGHFEMIALAIGEDNKAYEISWIFEDDGRELDEYDYTEVFAVRPVDVPVYLVQMVRGTEEAYDETSVPRTIYKTTSLEKAEEVFNNTERIYTDELDNEGLAYIYDPVIVQVWGEEETLMLD